MGCWFRTKSVGPAGSMWVRWFPSRIYFAQSEIQNLCTLFEQHFTHAVCVQVVFSKTVADAPPEHPPLVYVSGKWIGFLLFSSQISGKYCWFAHCSAPLVCKFVFTVRIYPELILEGKYMLYCMYNVNTHLEILKAYGVRSNYADFNSACTLFLVWTGGWSMYLYRRRADTCE